MRNRIGVAAAAILLSCAFALQGQQSMFKIELDPSGAMVALDQPVLMGGKYVFHAWPDGEQTSLKQAVVRKITRLTGPTHETIYQVELLPSGAMTARDNPVLKGNTYVFHDWRDGTLMSLRKSDVKKITPLTGDKAFWIEQGLMGEKKIGNLAIQGTNSVVEIGTPPTPRGSSQAGPTNANAVGRRGGIGNTSGISGAPAGNWQYEGTPGVADAWAPANATVSSPGDAPTMPAATNGSPPPTQPQP
jgi:hypothetical protein